MPVNAPISLNDDAPSKGPEPGIGLCLSGGGYRAMLFHVGSILRLNEVGLLSKLNRVSSVSGGSITAALLGMNWTKLDFSGTTGTPQVATNIRTLLVDPIRKLASETIDSGSIIGGILMPGYTIGDFVASKYEKFLYGQATLQSFPSDSEGPRFVINATSVQTASLVRFSKPYLADYKVGRIMNPEVSLAQAVAASSAFPPVLSPVTVDIDPASFEPDPSLNLQKLPFTDTMVLSDGGVYDNLGLEAVVKKYQAILVSDAGGKIAPEGAPAANWAEHSKRILEIVDDQVRNLRKRALIEAFTEGRRTGTYWGIRTNIADYRLADVLDAPVAKTMALAETPTRLKALSETRQNQLMNWGYAICDTALRAHVGSLLPHGIGKPQGFPFSGGVG